MIPSRSNPSKADPELGSAQETASFTQIQPGDGDGADASAEEIEQTQRQLPPIVE